MAKLVQKRCHSLLEGSHLFSDVTQIELCDSPVLLLVINHRAMSSQKEPVGRPAFDHSSQMRPIFHLSLELIQSKGGTAGGGAMVKGEPALVPIRKRKCRGIHTPTYSLHNSNIMPKS